MKKIEELKMLEVEAMSEFQEHIGLVLTDMDSFKEYLDSKEFRNFQKCYDYLDTLWEKIEDSIVQLCDADERGKWALFFSPERWWFYRYTKIKY